MAGTGSGSARRPWIVWIGLPALALYAALELYDQRPILAQDARPPVAAAAGREPFALVELFTSEGCSSCPSADALLNEISRDARRKGRRVYTLAFHVDYWDRLGWKDPYGDPAWTTRQKRSARALRLRSLYTPQMIVNGRTEFVGSRRRSARQAIQTALGTPARLGLTLEPGAPKAGKDGARRLQVAWTLDGLAPRRVLHVALTERGLVSRVRAGENRGRELKHDDVVRSLASLTLAKARAGKLEVVVPKGVDLSKAALVGFVQDPASRQVLAASRAALSPPGGSPSEPGTGHRPVQQGAGGLRAANQGRVVCPTPTHRKPKLAKTGSKTRSP